MNDTTSHTMQWEHYVMTMTKHKMLERMQKFTKEEYPTCEDFEVVKNCLQALFYKESLQHARKQQ